MCVLGGGGGYNDCQCFPLILLCRSNYCVTMTESHQEAHSLIPKSQQIVGRFDSETLGEYVCFCTDAFVYISLTTVIKSKKIVVLFSSAVSLC